MIKSVGPLYQFIFSDLSTILSPNKALAGIKVMLIKLSKREANDLNSETILSNIPDPNPLNPFYSHKRQYLNSQEISNECMTAGLFNNSFSSIH